MSPKYPYSSGPIKGTDRHTVLVGEKWGTDYIVSKDGSELIFDCSKVPFSLQRKLKDGVHSSTTDFIPHGPLCLFLSHGGV